MEMKRNKPNQNPKYFVRQVSSVQLLGKTYLLSYLPRRRYTYNFFRHTYRPSVDKQSFPTKSLLEQN